MITIELVEQSSTLVSPAILTPEVGRRLWQVYDNDRGQLRVEFPSPATAQQWRLTAAGWIGSISLAPQLQLQIQPKVPLANLFHMWAYAYDLSDWELLPGVVTAGSLTEFYEFLALALARQALRRTARGLQRKYVPQERPLAALRGRLQRPYPPPPPQVDLTCRYDTFTVDIPDNQILAYTLQQIWRSRRCAGEVETAVSRARRRLQTVTTHRVFTSADCVQRSYTRLTADYRPLHALCRFFLEQSGPAGDPGSHEMLPFLINMPQLFERFVAAWLQQNLPSSWHLQVQEHVVLGSRQELRFAIDLVLYERERKRPVMVLDTKYKSGDRPEAADINQIVTYAKARGCAEAVLIYPQQAVQPLDVQFRDLRVRRIAFPLDQDLPRAGQLFRAALFDQPGAETAST